MSPTHPGTAIIGKATESAIKYGAKVVNFRQKCQEKSLILQSSKTNGYQRYGIYDFRPCVDTCCCRDFYGDIQAAEATGGARVYSCRLS
mgnify:CR=1 FL=1